MTRLLKPSKYSPLISEISPPVARKSAHHMTIHGHQRTDQYYWMRDDTRTNVEVLAHLRAENAYANAVLQPQNALQALLLDELKSRIVKDDRSVPQKDGRYWYYSAISGEQEFYRYYRCDNKEGDNPQLLLDANARATEHEFYDLSELTISPNDEWLSFSEDTDSRRIYSIYFKKINSDNYLIDHLSATEGELVWANDNQHIFYIKKDLQTLLGTEVYRHKLGDDQAEDILVYRQIDLSFYMTLAKSRDDSSIFISLDATDSSHTLRLDASDIFTEFTELFEYRAGHEYQLEKLADYYYIVTNWQAKNFKLMRAKTSQINDMQQWQELFAHSDDVLLEDLELFDEYYVLSLREKGQTSLAVYPMDTAKNNQTGYTLGFDDSCYTACVGDNPEPQSHCLRVEYTSLTTPSSCYEFNLITGERLLLKQQQVMGNFDSQHYASQRLFVDARDAAQIPISVVYRKDLFKQDASNPVLQYAYGAYGITVDPCFSSSNLSLLDRGFVFVIAHVRGSQMLGRNWYEQGKKEHKQNTFNDFIDVTRYLVANQYGAADKVFASGGSAGGLLMGAILNQAPELYLGVGCHVPFVDIVTSMLDESIPLTTNEYEEWGNPNYKKDYHVMLKYSPVDNVKPIDYPNILVTTGLHDSQVQYFEPMKWVAKLREYKTNNNALLFKTDMNAGHGGAAGRFNSLEESALEMAFFITLAAAE